MMPLRTCFVISPIGKEDTETRENADKVLYHIIQPALEKYHFDVRRADQVVSNRPINDEVIKLIQQSDLCIIDLSGLNPNVLYEAGRRHETGRPAIHLMREGDQLPFDLYVHRTIFYKLDTLEDSLKYRRELQKYIDYYENIGYGEAPAGESLASMSAKLDRIERRLSAIAGVDPVTRHSPSISQPELAFMNPREAFKQAYERGDILGATFAFNRFRDVKGVDDEETLTVACILARACVPEAGALLETVLNNFSNYHFADGELRNAIASYVEFRNAMNSELDGFRNITEFVETTIPSIEQASTKAFCYNQLQRLLYSGQDFDRALSFANMTIENDSSIPSYFYNRSLIYQKKRQLQDAQADIEKCLAIANEKDPDHLDPDHLDHAAEVYAQLGKLTDLERIIGVARSANPAFEARILRNSDVQNVLSERRQTKRR